MTYLMWVASTCSHYWVVNEEKETVCLRLRIGRSLNHVFDKSSSEISWEVVCR